ncbi:MAG TPA: butyrate kinase [Spirochaetia bacterium]|nr:butyrate kinase [Spirochaetia bacterium]
MALKILAINPGSTSTKLALYDDTNECWKKGVSHASEDIARFRRIQDQLELRSSAVNESLAEAGIRLSDISAVVGRGGLLKPLAGGVYEVNEQMKADLIACKYGTHASNLGALIADAIASEIGVKAYIVDPVVVDELDPIARYSGIPQIPRRSIFHALNQKATAKKAARSLGKKYADCTLIVAHMGGGTSIGIHERGRVVDVNNALDGEGPFAIERAGTVPAGDWMRWILSHQHDPQALQLMLTGRGGLVAYLGTNEFQEIEKSAMGGGELDANLSNELIRALCYQIAKCIAGLAAFTAGELDAIVLTGGMAFSDRVVREISTRVSFLAPVLLFPGENELEALAMGVREVLLGEAQAMTYRG